VEPVGDLGHSMGMAEGRFASQPLLNHADSLMGAMLTFRASLLRLSGALALALAAGLPVEAADTVDPAAPGQGRSTSFAPLPAGVAIAARPLDNSDTNLRVASSFAEALARRGYRRGDASARYALNFDIEVQPIRQPSLKPTAGETRGPEPLSNDMRGIQPNDMRGNLDDSQFRIQMGNANPEDVQPRRGDLTSRGSLRYVMTATLDDQQTGQRLWQGVATYADSATDEQAAYTLMASALADQLGRTVRQRSFGGE
jgi:hypothetical protein